MAAEITNKDRDEKTGRLVKGNKAGVGFGRPRRMTDKKYRQLVKDQVGEDIWKQIVDKQIEKALAGDVNAVIWLSQFR